MQLGTPRSQISYGAGWYPTEYAEGGSFAWMSTAATLDVSTSGEDDIIIVEYSYPALSSPIPELIVGHRAYQLYPGYNSLLIPVSEVASHNSGIASLTLSIERLAGFYEDQRALGLKVHRISVESDPVVINYKKTQAAIAARPEVCDNTPIVYMIGVTDRCNLRCVICLKHHEQEGDNNKDLIDLPDPSLEKLMPLAYSAQMVLLLGYGEPLLNKQLPEIIDDISAKADNSIEMITNGLLLSPQWIDKILSRNVRVLSISMDAATPDGYERMRGGSYEKVIRNVQALVAERAKRKDAKLEIRMNMAVTRANITEVPLLSELAADLGVDTVEFRHLHENPLHAWRVEKPDFVFDYNEALIENDPEECRAALNDAIRRAKRRGVRYILDAPFVGLVDDELVIAADVEVGEYHECPHPWRWLMVTAAGDAYTCCWAPPLAKLADYNSGAELWNGQEYRRLRRNIKAGVVDPLCAGVTCPFQQKAISKDAPVNERPAPVI
ncbi:radical SAM/SPASM domain-containing protein [Rhodopseudomonas sp.]|uniref:radical SAM protein n=1 Tax=Rhodopseudomonas sp. TaxID=1078 RepID=UPI003B3A77B9